MIGRGRFAGEEEGARWHGEALGPGAVVQHDDVQNVEQLALVLVNALDLAIKNRIRVDYLTGRFLEPAGETLFRGLFGFAEFGTELFVIREREKFAQVRQV